VNISTVSRVTSPDRGGVARGGGQIVIKTSEDALRRRDAKHGGTSVRSVAAATPLKRSISIPIAAANVVPDASRPSRSSSAIEMARQMARIGQFVLHQESSQRWPLQNQPRHPILCQWTCTRLPPIQAAEAFTSQLQAAMAFARRSLGLQRKPKRISGLLKTRY